MALGWWMKSPYAGLARVCLLVFEAARGAAWGRVARPERCAQFADGAV